MRLLCLVVLFVSGFFSASADSAILRLATTTSVENSGLLDYLLPSFHQRCQCQVYVMSVGSGKAMVLGRRGDADLLITHSPVDEIQFIKEGNGVNRHSFMYNSFVLLGPDTSVTNSMETVGVEKVMAIIADKNLTFLSRGDDSGTHKKEVQLWGVIQDKRQRSIDFSPKWYISAGIGMGQAILMANEMRAFVLSDIGTYRYFRQKVDMQVVVQDTPPLINPYSVMMVNPKKHPHVNKALAELFVDWIISDTTQQKIADYQFLGEPLFKVDSFSTSHF